LEALATTIASNSPKKMHFSIVDKYYTMQVEGMRPKISSL
jgi:hypothetical protein